MKRIAFTFIFAMCILPAWAQTDAFPTGARAWAVGNATSTLADVWAVGNNPAGIASVEKVGIGLSYHASPLMISNFNTFALVYAQALPAKRGVLGAQVSRFGDKVYSETKLGLAYAYSFQKLHIAVKTNFVQIAQQTLGSQARFTFEFGAQVPLNKYLKLGAHIYNFTQSSFVDGVGKAYSIPTSLRLGLAYQPISSLSLFGEIEKTLTLPASPRLGVEYEIHKNLTLRTGVQAHGQTASNTQTFAQFAGLGLKFKQVRLAYALASQNGLGVGHHIGVSWQK